ncbi:MAG TPA: TolC family protein [Anaeromyxobacter sp.]
MVTLPTAAALALAALASAAPGATPAPEAPAVALPAVEELPLQAALDELDRANPTLAQARARGAEASALVRQSWSALLPTLTAQAQALRNRDAAELTIPPPIAPLPRTVILQPLHSLTVQGSARVPLLAPSSWWDVAAARDAERASDASVEAARRNLKTSFVQAAHASRAAEELVVASDAAVKSAAELERSAARRVAAGTSPPLDRLRAETELTRRESDLAQARANLERSRFGLGVLLGRDRPVRVVVPELAPPPDAAAPDALARGALEARPELAAQRAQVAAAEAGVKSAWARLAPQVSASASYFASDTAYPTGEKDGWRVTLDLVWPLYDGGFRYGKLRQAQAQLSAARAGEEAQRLAVVQDVVDASRDVSVAAERLRLAESQRRLASDAAASARRGFEAGVASSLDVIDANDRLYLADVGLADARARLAQAAVGLDRAAGR